MNRKEKPVQRNTHELTDKEYAEYKHQEKEKRKRAEKYRYDPFVNKGRY